MDVILLARGLDILAIWVETDLTIAIHCISTGGEPWTFQSIRRQISELISFNKDIVFHIYGERN